MKAMFQQLRLQIGIYDESVILSDYRDKNAIKRYEVDPANLPLLLNSEGIRLTPVPGLISMIHHGDRSDYLFKIPRSKSPIDIMYRQTNSTPVQHFKASLPPLLLRVGVFSGQVNNLEAYVYRGGDPLTAPAFYALPLPNFAASDLCIGALNIPVTGVDSVRSAAFDTMFAGYFNNHRDVCGKQGLNLPAYMEKYQGKMPFSSLRQIALSRETKRLLFG